MTTIKSLFLSTLVALGFGGLATPALAQPTWPRAQVLRRWFIAHVHWPYPTDAELAALAAETYLPVEEVTSWLTRARANHDAGASGPSVPASAQASSPQTAADERMADLDPANSSAASALQPPAPGPDISRVELLQPDSSAAAQGTLNFGRGIIAGRGFGSDPTTVEVTFIEKHGGFHIIEQIELLSDDKIHFDLGDVPCNLTRGRFLVTVNGKTSTPKKGFLPPPPQVAGAAAAASAASQAQGCSLDQSQASRKRKGASPAQEEAASAHSSSSGSESDGSSSSEDASSSDEGAGSAAAQPAKRPKRYSAQFKRVAMQAYAEAKSRGDATVTMEDVAMAHEVPRRTFSNWLVAAGIQPPRPVKTYSLEEKAAAVSKFRQERRLGHSKAVAAQATGIPLSSIRNWDRGLAMDQKAYSMSEKATYKKQIKKALARGVSLETIAADLGIPLTTANNWVKKRRPPTVSGSHATAGQAPAVAAGRADHLAESPAAAAAHPFTVVVPNLP